MFRESIEDLIIYPSKIAISKANKDKLIAESNSVYYQKEIGSVSGVELRLLFNSSIDIPVLPTPIKISSNTKESIIIDVRPYVSKISSDNRFENTFDYKVKNLPELNQQVLTAVLMALWTEGSKAVFNNTIFAMEAMTKLISGTIVSRLGLDVVTGSEIEVYTSLMYIANSIRDKKLLRDEIYLASKIKKVSMVPTSKIIDMITGDKGTILEDAKCLTPKSLADTISEMNNPRLDKFEFATMLNLLTNLSSFYAYDVRMMASLEYPPTWIPMVYGALTDKRHKKSYLATKIASIKSRNKELEVFEKYVEGLFDLIEYDKETGK